MQPGSPTAPADTARAQTDADTPGIRVGVIMDSLAPPAWHYAVLDSIARSGYASLALAVVSRSHGGREGRRRTLLYQAYDNLEQRMLPRSPDAFARVDARSILSGVPLLEAHPVRDGGSGRFSREEVERVRESRLDVLVHLGSWIPEGEILDAARHGLWAFSLSDISVIRGGPAGFWETFLGRDERGTMLRQLTADGGEGRLLYRSSFRCDSLFVSRNNNDCFLTTSLFVERVLSQLRRGGDQALPAAAPYGNTVEFYDDALYSAPSDTQFVPLFIRHYLRKGMQILKGQFVHPQWFLLYGLADHIPTELWRFKKIIPPKDRFWADPHVILRDDTYHIFVEEFLYRKRRGHIAILTMDQSGSHSDSEKVLDEPFHLSYPHLVEQDGTLYMVPETYQDRRISLYECTDFPRGWKRRATLMDSVKAVDTTLHFSKGRWWMFTNISVPEGTFNANELFVFYSDDLFSGEWTSHPMNPVVSDVKRARSAGRIFTQDGLLIRPSQCCAPTYGYGIKLNEIVTLTETDYREREKSFIEPKWDRRLNGVHTFCHVDRLTLIDGYYNTLNLF